MISDPTSLAILGLALWTIALLVAIAILRTRLSVFTARAANSFSPSGEDVSPFSHRLCRAHANCYEFLPFALAILLYGVATGQNHITDPLALTLLALRVGQSTIHLISTSRAAVILRFTLMLPQALILVYWIVGFATLA